MSPMYVPFSILLGVAAIVFVSGLIKALNSHLRMKHEQAVSNVDESDITSRLNEVESRLRDVLDVMIAVSEKMDRWEHEGMPAPNSQRSM
jgi:hypothetical protein